MAGAAQGAANHSGQAANRAGCAPTGQAVGGQECSRPAGSQAGQASRRLHSQPPPEVHHEGGGPPRAVARPVVQVQRVELWGRRPAGGASRHDTPSPGGGRAGLVGASRPPRHPRLGVSRALRPPACLAGANHAPATCAAAPPNLPRIVLDNLHRLAEHQRAPPLQPARQLQHGRQARGPAARAGSGDNVLRRRRLQPNRAAPASPALDPATKPPTCVSSSTRSSSWRATGSSCSRPVTNMPQLVRSGVSSPAQRRGQGTQRGSRGLRCPPGRHEHVCCHGRRGHGSPPDDPSARQLHTPTASAGSDSLPANHSRPAQPSARLTRRHLGALEMRAAQAAHRGALCGRQESVGQQQAWVLRHLAGRWMVAVG